MNQVNPSNQIIRPFTDNTHVFNNKEVPPVTPGENNFPNSTNGTPKIDMTTVPIIPVDYYKTKTMDRPTVQFPAVDPNDGSINMYTKDTLNDQYKDLFGVGPVNSIGTKFQVNYDNMKEHKYNSYEDWQAPAFNQWSRIGSDSCNEENRLKIASKPMRYYINELTTPQAQEFQSYTIVGNAKQYNVRNDFERAIPTRLNPLYDIPVLPYSTTPFLGQSSVDRRYVETSNILRRGDEPRGLKSEIGSSEINYNRWDPGVYGQTVQNAGQYTSMKIQSATPRMMNDDQIRNNQDEYYNPMEQNNVLFMNSAVPYFGIDSRNLYRNMINLSGC
jgi:hypothetical protein